MALGKMLGGVFMWIYEKKLQYPVDIKKRDVRMAKAIYEELGGSDGELSASMEYLQQRYTMPTGQSIATLTDIGTEELAHLEIISAMIYQLTRNLSIEQIEFLMKHNIITREQLAVYREPLQKQIAELMKERRRLYRNGGRETGEERLSEINEELKRLRKEVRMTVQIEKHSLEIEARLQEAEEQSQNEKRVEDKERMQKSQEVR